MDYHEPLAEPLPEETPGPAEKPVLNADADFVRSVPAAIRNLFDGMPAKVYLRPGEIFYRFLEKDFAGAIDGLWLTADAYHRIRTDNRLQGRPIPDWAVTPTVHLPHKLHPMQFCQANLVEPVYAFRGALRGTGTPPHMFFYVPALTPDLIIPRTYNL